MIYYVIPFDVFVKHKKGLDGFIFWKQDDDDNYIVRQVCPNKEVRKFLEINSIRLEYATETNGSEAR